MDVFDLTRTHDRISPFYAFPFYLLFLAVGLGLSGMLLYLAFRHRRLGALFYLPLALPIALGAGWLMWHDMQHVRAVKAKIQSGQFASAEGCLSQFHPGLASPNEADSGFEQWSVAGLAFEYSADEVRFGYHQVEPNGGLVHADSWVRVGYVDDDVLGRRDIVRLEVQQHACPPAPDIR